MKTGYARIGWYLLVVIAAVIGGISGGYGNYFKWSTFGWVLLIGSLLYGAISFIIAAVK